MDTSSARRSLRVVVESERVAGGAAGQSFTIFSDAPPVDAARGAPPRRMPDARGRRRRARGARANAARSILPVQGGGASIAAAGRCSAAGLFGIPAARQRGFYRPQICSRGAGPETVPVALHAAVLAQFLLLGQWPSDQSQARQALV